jgi:hypothetical protein
MYVIGSDQLNRKAKKVVLLYKSTSAFNDYHILVPKSRSAPSSWKILAQPSRYGKANLTSPNKYYCLLFLFLEEK